MDSKEKKDKGIAVAATIVVHALAVLVLVLMAFKTPTPLPAEEGVEVNLGSSNEGLGEIQPEKLASQKKASTPPQTKQETSKSEEENITDDNSENPPINESKKTKTKTEPKQEKKTEQPQQRSNPRAEFKSNNNDSEESAESDNDLKKNTFEGNTKGSDDQGKINGSKDSKNYKDNGGKGTVNVGYNDKRGSKDLPKPSENFPEQGDVTIKIWINRNGSVTKAEIDRKYTNVINSTQREQARQAALRSTFVSDSNAPDPYVTSITYHYIEN